MLPLTMCYLIQAPPRAASASPFDKPHVPAGTPCCGIQLLLAMPKDTSIPRSIAVNISNPRVIFLRKFMQVSGRLEICNHIMKVHIT